MYFVISSKMEILAIEQFSALSHSKRLAVFRLLIRRYPDAVAAGEIAAFFEAAPSSMSSYLATLEKAGLITHKRRGTSLLYTANLKSLDDLQSYLFQDCGRGRLSLKPSGVEIVNDKKLNVLFICVGNSARSIFAETILRDTAADRFNVYSAGTRPGSSLNQFAMQVMKDKGHDVSVLRAKHVSEFITPDAPRFDFVFTVCDLAANEECPSWDGQPISGHWGMPDPVKVEGTNAEKALAFQQAYGMLMRRIEAFISIPFEELDRRSIQREIDNIAKN